MNDQGDLSADEVALLEHSGAFLRELEKTKMFKSYKPVVILGMLAVNGFELGATVEQLAAEFRRHFLKPKYQIDLIGTEILMIAETSGPKLASYVKDNPINAWCLNNKEFFKLGNNGLFTYSRELPQQLEFFYQWIREIAEYRIEHHMSKIGTDQPAHKIVWGRGPKDKPHIQIDREHSDLPDDEQFHVVMIDGEKYLAKFVKIAINVIRDATNDTSLNILEELLRKSFPEKDRDFLSTRKVRITQIANDVGYEISFV